MRVSYVPTIANIAAPTVAELNAGTILTSQLIPTGLEGFEPTQAGVDNTSLASTFDTQKAGRLSFSTPGLIFKKQDGTDTIFNLLTAGTAGFVVVRANGVLTGTAYAASQFMRVFPGECGEAYMVGLGEANSLERFRLPWFITAQPNFRAVSA